MRVLLPALFESGGAAAKRQKQTGVSASYYRVVKTNKSVSKDKDCGIINDAYLCATETMGNSKYPLQLFLRAITVSLETMKVVHGLPKLEV